MSQQAKDPELKAIRQIKDALQKLPPSKRKRVVEYVRDTVIEELAAPPQATLPGV